MSITQQIRTAIAPLHNQIEKTAYSHAIMSGGLSVDDYVVSIAQLLRIHEAVETHAANEPVAGFFDPAMARTEALQRDLGFWGADLGELTTLPETDRTVAWIHSLHRTEPIGLLGLVYVLEGSRMGSLVIAKPLAAALGTLPVEGKGLDYHTEGARETPMRLKSWKAKIDQNPFSQLEIESIIQSSVTFMDLLNQVYDALPVSEPRRAQSLRADVA